MAEVTTKPTTEVRLTRDAVVSLLKEARERFENGAHELYSCSNDESQRPTIAACTEIIGRVGELIDRPWRWPHKETPYGKEEEALTSIEFSPATMDWIRWQRDQQAPYVEDFDTGVSGGDPGYLAEQVYLLHVLEGILRQSEAGA